MECVNCARSLEPGAEFCPYCGARQAPGAHPIAPSPQDAEKPLTRPSYSELRAQHGGISWPVFFMKPLLERFDNGRFFKRAFAIYLYILASMIGLAGIVGWVIAWAGILAAAEWIGVAGVISGLFMQIVSLIGLYMLIHTIILRAENVNALPDGRFTLIPIASISLRLVGELIAIVVVTTSVAAGVTSILIGSTGRFGLFSDMLGLGVGGLIGALGGLVLAFFLLAFFYYMAEVVKVLAEIAINTRKTWESLAAGQSDTAAP